MGRICEVSLVISKICCFPCFHQASCVKSSSCLKGGSEGPVDWILEATMVHNTWLTNNYKGNICHWIPTWWIIMYKAENYLEEDTQKTVTNLTQDQLRRVGRWLVIGDRLSSLQTWTTTTTTAAAAAVATTKTTTPTSIRTTTTSALLKLNL